MSTPNFSLDCNTVTGVAQALQQSLETGLASQGQSLPSQWQQWQQDYQGQPEKSTPEHLRILLLEPDPLKFCAAVITFLQRGRGRLFLGNPAWQEQERQAITKRIKPQLLWTPANLQPQRQGF